MLWTLLLSSILLIFVLAELYCRKLAKRFALVEDDGTGKPKTIPILRSPMVSNLQLVYYILGGLMQGRASVQRLLALRDNGGDIGKLKTGISTFLGRQIVLTWNPEFNRELLFKHEVFQKVDFGALSKYLNNSVLMLEGDAWKRHRMILNPSFHFEHLKNLVPAMNRVAAQLSKSIEEQEIASGSDHTELKMREWMQRATLDILGKTTFGHDFNALSTERSESLQNYDDFMKEMSKPVHIMPAVDKLLGTQKKMIDVMEKFMSFVRVLIEEKIERVKTDSDFEPVDLMDLMVMAHVSPNGEWGSLSMDELLNNAFIFFLAGHETSAAAMSSLIQYLAENPSIQQRVYDELTNNILSQKPVDEATYDDLASLKYLNCCIKETLRMCPPALGLVRTAMEDTTIGGYFIPKGTWVMSSFITIHSDTDYWDEPMTFNPDRFLAKNKATQARCTYTPFSLGPRQCIGNNFAMAEMRAVVSALLSNFEICQSSASPKMEPFDKTFLSPPPECTVILRKRNQ